MNIRPNPSVAVLAGLMKWISTGADGRPEFAPGSLEFIWRDMYEVDGRVRKTIYVFKQGALLGRLIPIYEENTDRLVKWLIQRDTIFGVFIEEVDGTYDYMADYAINMFLIDPEIIKHEYEERARLRTSSSKLFNGDLPGQVREKAEDPIPAKVTESLITVKEFLKTISNHQPLDNNQLGEVVGCYRLTDTDELAKLGFECFIAGDSVENWVQVLVLENGTSKFPRILGTFRHDQGFISIESRFFKGEVRADDKSNLVNAINTYLVKPYANNRAK